MVKLLINEQEVKFETTIFPDGTSQIWKMESTEFDQYGDDAVILWLFENEGELMQVIQLANLVDKMFGADCTLRVPYLPYGRQDKEISNETSFALKTFVSILYNAHICRIETFDAHSKASSMVYPQHGATTDGFHRTLLKNNGYDLICYPDKGAADRYALTTSYPFIWAEKVRDQLTGEITGLNLVTNGQDLHMKDILIVDDICDGGMTFIKVAQALKAQRCGDVDLAVSHGLFSKGKQVLYDAGINMIYTTNSLLRNPEGYKVW